MKDPICQSLLNAPSWFVGKINREDDNDERMS